MNGQLTDAIQQANERKTAKSAEEMASEHAKKRGEVYLRVGLDDVEDAFLLGHASRDEAFNEALEVIREFIHEANEAYGENDIARLVPMIDEAREFLSKHTTGETK